jgi:hypothetical protein
MEFLTGTAVASREWDDAARMFHEALALAGTLDGLVSSGRPMPRSGGSRRRRAA